MTEIELKAEEVIRFYLKKLEDPNFAIFIKNEYRDEIKADLAILIKEVLNRENKNYFHDLITKCQLVWKKLFVNAMTFIDSNCTGFTSLITYFDKFADFEELLYSTDDFYRDHTTHVLWTYFLAEWMKDKLKKDNEKYPFYIKGVDKATSFLDQNREFIKRLYVKHIGNNDTNNYSSLKLLRKLAKKNDLKKYEKPKENEELWRDIIINYVFLDKLASAFSLEQAVTCLTFLCHDLGYPLKRIKNISNKVSDILPDFNAKEMTKYAFSIEGGVKSFLTEIIKFISGDFVFTENLNLVYQKDQSLYMNLLMDSETYEHGLMSAFLLSLKVQSIISNAINIDTELDFEAPEIWTSISKVRILRAIALHTCKRYKLIDLRNLDSFLIFIDFIEEFSRMTRASLLGTRIEEFCKTFIYIEDNEDKFYTFVFKYVFDKDRPEGLDPELTFKSKGEFIKSRFDLKDLSIRLKVIVVDVFSEKEEPIVYTLIYENNEISIEVSGFKNDEKKKELAKIIKKDSVSIIIDSLNE